MELKLSDFYYDLPKELIAQDPLEDRSSSRLMHIDRKTGAYEHKKFTDIIDYLNCPEQHQGNPSTFIRCTGKNRKQ